MAGVHPRESDPQVQLEPPGRRAYLVLFLLAVGGLLSTPVTNLVSRQIEANADLFALDLTGDPDAFISMQQRLAETNLSDPDPPAAWQWFFGSHPTVAERVAMAQDWERLAEP